MPRPLRRIKRLTSQAPLAAALYRQLALHPEGALKQRREAVDIDRRDDPRVVRPIRPESRVDSGEATTRAPAGVDVDYRAVAGGAVGVKYRRHRQRVGQQDAGALTLAGANHQL